ncbi:disulfide bond formation protein B [Novosphingobium olei]|uniref:Disulfide bond formation protein B n=1 Tax=Novosphingobium olei TaxID=2728851 RepID=A0A7Y0G9G6_9SPHN|nr:disulfide bond formation protein B [Novosphingobium olei]NML93023.1 disulfide bond formation protein B [Novosphingobium olei]
MTPQQSRSAAYTLALLVPAALMGGALVSQYVFGLYPCEMCWWQRYPHIAAIVLAGLALALRKSPLGDVFVRLAAIAIGISGLIGAFHAGVEYHWWEGLTACTRTASAGGDPLAAIMDAPVIRCDVAQWTLFGVSLAGFNFLISTVGAVAVFVLLGRGKTRIA